MLGAEHQALRVLGVGELDLVVRLPGSKQQKRFGVRRVKAVGIPESLRVQVVSFLIFPGLHRCRSGIAERLGRQPRVAGLTGQSDAFFVGRQRLRIFLLSS